MEKEITFAPIWDRAMDAMQKKTVETSARSLLYPDILFCTVTNLSPLILTIDETGKEIKNNIAVSEKVTDHEVEMIAIKPEPHRTSTEQSIMGNNSDFLAHSHTYKGGWFKAKYGLKEGDKVIVFRHSDGQRYWVADRVGEV